MGSVRDTNALHGGAKGLLGKCTQDAHAVCIECTEYIHGEHTVRTHGVHKVRNLYIPSVHIVCTHNTQSVPTTCTMTT